MFGICEETGIIGAFCTLIVPYRGYTEGSVIEEYGSEILIRLTNGKELSVYRDEVIISD